jgi:oxaloacetate decarboxylase gamma subunit
MTNLFFIVDKIHLIQRAVYMEFNLVAEGLKFMVLGMVTVFLFLILMVIILNFQAKIVSRFFPPKVVDSASNRVPLAKSSVKKDNNAMVAAITAAIMTHKKTNS